MLLGWEKLALQGIFPERPDAESGPGFDKLAGDLAGNAFHANVFIAVFVSMIAAFTSQLADMT